MYLRLRTSLRVVLILLFLRPIASITQLNQPTAAHNALDTLAIQQTINLFAVAVDQHRWDLLTQVFAPHVTANFNSPGGSVLHGILAVVNQLKVLENIPSVHEQSTIYVDWTDLQRPHATTYVTGVFFGDGRGGERVQINHGRYEDDLVRWPDGWRILQRSLVHMGSTRIVEGISSPLQAEGNVSYVR